MFAQQDYTSPTPSTHRDDARQLWERCFNDPKAFVDLYFDKVYTEIDTLIEYDGTQPIAQLQMRPYRLILWRNYVQMGYISGACTHPQYRGKGLMSTMIRRAIREMYERRDIVTTLIPAEDWLFDFYKKAAGYSTAFYYREVHLDRAPTVHEIEEATADINVSVYHNSKQWEIIKDDLSLAGGDLLRENNHNMRIAYVPRKDGLHILSVMNYEDNAIKKITNRIARLRLEHQGSCIILRLPPYKSRRLKKKDSYFGYVNKSLVEGGDLVPHGMIRILNLPLFLSAFLSMNSHISFSFYYQDPLLPENDGCYRLNNGTVTHSRCRAQESLPHFDPASLAERLFSHFPGFLNLMLD